MKVSIVTVSFNSAATIEETLRSVLDQDGVEVEYIVVDGASTDGTPEIIRRYAPRLAWWVSEPDKGQVDALNKGFQQATGEIFGFLNADDVLQPGALRSVCDAFAARPEADLVYGSVEWINFAGEPQGSHFGRISNLEDILDIFAVWWGERQWVQPEVFFRRSLHSRVGPLDGRYHLAFDYDFWVRCFLADVQVARIDQSLVRFRRHAGQKSVDYERACDELRAIAAHHLATTRKLPLLIRTRLLGEIGYDIYQSSPAQRGAFLPALLQHPSWLLGRKVRERLAASLRKKMGDS